MLSVKLEYCINGYDTKEVEINCFGMLKSKLIEIKNEATGIIKSIFTVDVVVDGKGRMSIGLDEDSILAYTSFDFEDNMTSLGNESSQGTTLYYFGDYSIMSNKYIIPYNTALDVLKTWIEFGEISDIIQWTDEIY